MFETLMIDKIWNNLDFWHTLFWTIIVSVAVIKGLTKLDQKASVFNKYKIHDMAVYNKLSGTLTPGELNKILDKLDTINKMDKETLDLLEQFEHLMSSDKNRYKSEILRMKVDRTVRSLIKLESFLKANCGLDRDNESFILLPELKYAIEASGNEPSDNKDVYAQKQKDLKNLVQKVRENHASYMDIIRKYLHV